MSFPNIEHHGATRDVSGSCHQVHLDASHSLLIDCGLYQGGREHPAVDGELGFSVNGIEALLVTHVHMDHVGRIPELLAAGFDGPIICSQPSAHLLPLVLEDAFKLAYTRDQGAVERYLKRVERAVVALPYGQWHELYVSTDRLCRVRLQRAGHVLGSAYLECDLLDSKKNTSVRMVFSGDLGAAQNPLLVAPQSPERADVLVLESTYGNRLHEERATRQSRLERVIERALLDQGTVLIPAFSIGRTQELLFEIEDILYRKALLADAGVEYEGRGIPPMVDWPQLPVILDSPLANKLTRAFRQLSSFWNQSARQRLSEGRKPLAFNQLIAIESAAQHRQVVNYLASTGRPAIVIAGNGMCSGGRIVSYLKAMLEDSRHEIVFSGYQARGTPGAVIQASEGAEGFVMIDLDAQMYEIKAKVVTLGGYSAHADQRALLDFVTGMQQWPERIVLVHGDHSAKQVLAGKLRELYERAAIPLCIDIPI